MPNCQAGDTSARGQGGDAAAREQDNSDADVEKWNVEMEFIEDNDRINELMPHFDETRLDSITKTFMEGMSVELREWLMKVWPVHHGGDGRE